MRESSYSKMIIVLVGNKIDLAHEREVSTSEGQRFAEQNQLLFFETSAKSGENVATSFLESAEAINENIKKGTYDLRTENIGIKPGNTFKSTLVDNQIKPKSLLRDGNQAVQEREKKCCT
mmetsp:Transcript_17215/g.26589  ORF Transcript_17215/g.26589 Transcript_17215/m.26589 type:complete len:120 (-) Transcript_17215:33-392(-)|eukprot:CAMPEP_0170479082 /NCGR_PEP_ID=MMETSP0208-20121228/439_1 /TAXON_ID=197538 /ORGANISM="Strombidium inclinatum, Strain S3" /LENGTH=119 /DNA_ID=CAMNT_0010751423 /DNA_START=333 /DNA_END=692 /DNA_ORIENTATION=+